MTKTIPDVSLKRVSSEDLKILLPLVADYHVFEQIDSTKEEREKALIPLLKPGSNFVSVYLILFEQEMVGYIALCFGYSIEFGGRDAFIDEFYIVESMRGKKIGTEVLRQIKVEASKLDIKALHLEVANSNYRAKKLYESLGFESREKFHLLSCML